MTAKWVKYMVQGTVEKWALKDILVITANGRMILLFRNADQVVESSIRMYRGWLHSLSWEQEFCLSIPWGLEMLCFHIQLQQNLWLRLWEAEMIMTNNSCSRNGGKCTGRGDGASRLANCGVWITRMLGAIVKHECVTYVSYMSHDGSMGMGHLNIRIHIWYLYRVDPCGECPF